MLSCWPVGRESWWLLQEAWGLRRPREELLWLLRLASPLRPGSGKENGTCLSPKHTRPAGEHLPGTILRVRPDSCSLGEHQHWGLSKESSRKKLFLKPEATSATWGDGSPQCQDGSSETQRKLSQSHDLDCFKVVWPTGLEEKGKEEAGAQLGGRVDPEPVLPLSPPDPAFNAANPQHSFLQRFKKATCTVFKINSLENRTPPPPKRERIDAEFSPI